MPKVTSVRKKIVIGLTGGIATGKTSVLREFRRLGARVLDCDILARAVVRKGRPAWKKIAKTFGKPVLKNDGSLNRAQLGRIVFKSPVKRRILEGIIHPQVKTMVLKAARKARSGVLVVDVPLLFEAGWKKLFDRTVLVYSPEKIQIQRLGKRDGFGKKEALTRIHSQWALKRKKKLADHAIDNSGDFSRAQNQVRKLWKKWEAGFFGKKL